MKKDIIPNLNISGQIYMRPYQQFAQWIFETYSDELRWFILDFVMGSGKTLTALNIIKHRYTKILIIGNEVSQNSFMKDLQTLNKQDNIKLNINYITIQKLSQIDLQTAILFCQNSYIIVDELQRLYNPNSLNSYGERLRDIYKQLKQNIKLICLTGTMFNGSINELNLLKQIFDCEQYNIQQFSRHIITYQKQQKHFMPQILYQTQGKQDQFPLIKVPMNKDQYEAYLKNNNEEEQKLLVKYWYDGQTYKSNHIIKGKQLLYENVNQFSPIVYKFLDILFDKSQKSVLYCDLINTQFGLYQYIELLETNGLIQYGDKIHPQTRCLKCNKSLKDHKDTSHFIPFTFAVYSNESKKKELSINVYNSYDNINGDKIALLLITRIAQTGLSLRCVRRFFITDNIPYISLLNQIIARAVRHKSHSELQQQDRNVKIYVLCPCGPKEEQTIYEKRWYNIKEEDDKIQQLYKQIHKYSWNLDNSKLIMNSTPDIIYRYETSLIQYLQQINIKQIKLEELIKLIRNDELNPYGFSFNLLTEQQIVNCIKCVYKIVNNICIIPPIFSLRRQYPQQFDQQFNDYKQIQIEHKNTFDIIQQIDSINNVNTIRYYVKIYLSQGIDFKEFFFSNTIFTAFMIYENCVYIKGDEDNYIQNHYELMKDIILYDIQEIKQNLKKIIKQHKIEGYYLLNKVITQQPNKFLLISQPIQQNQIIYQNIFVQIHQFKLIRNESKYNCLQSNPQYEEIFEDYKYLTKQQYDNLLQYQKCRQILLYSLFSERICVSQIIVKN